MSEPLVSVVLPTFNRPDYLRLALATAVAQTYRNIEIIVQDNASPQDIGAVVAEFNDPRISFFRNHRNIGQTPNFVSSMMKAKGEFVALLGDDDKWHPEFIETLVAPMIADPDIVVAFCNHDFIDAEGRSMDEHTDRFTKWFGRHVLAAGKHKPFNDIALVYRSIAIVSGALMRADAIDWRAFPVDMLTFADIHICYLLAVTGKAAHYEPRPLMSIRWHTGTVTHAIDKEHMKLARFGLAFWGTFLADERLAEQADYFRMICARKAAKIMANRLAQRDFKGTGDDLSTFVKMGLLHPRVIIAHIAYLIRLRREGLARILP